MSDNARLWLSWIFLIGLLGLTIAVGVVALSADNSGRQPNNHPETYTRLSDPDTVLRAAGGDHSQRPRRPSEPGHDL